MNSEQNREEKNCELELRIFLDVEVYLKNRGLIKMSNGYEHYEEGTETLRDNLVKEFIKSYYDERSGTKKPFFTGKLGLEGAIAVACGNRIKGFLKQTFCRRIDIDSAIDEYTFSVQSNSNNSNELHVDVARPENVSSRFGEPINLCDQSAQLVLEEAELYSAFQAALDRISAVGKNGMLYCRTIQFYLEEFDEEMSKKDEISALAEFLGVSRGRAVNAKYWALRYLKRELSGFFDYEEYAKSMRRNMIIAERFKKISKKNILKSYDRRYNLFLHPYLGQRIACTIRVLRLVDDGKGDGPAPGKPEAVADKSEAAVKSDFA